MSAYRLLKEECCEANLALARWGLGDLTFGNASVADVDRGVLAIKPSGMSYDALTTADMVVVDIAKGEVIEGELRPSTDTPTHRRLYQALGGIRSIVHTHSRHAVIFATAGRSIPCLNTTHADHFYGEVPVTRALTPQEIAGAYEWETGNVIAEQIQGRPPLQVPAVLVRSHGPFVWGLHGAQAVENALALEIVAEIAWKTLILEPDAVGLSRELLDRHFLRKHGADAYYGQKP